MRAATSCRHAASSSIPGRTPPAPNRGHSSAHSSASQHRWSNSGAQGFSFTRYGYASALAYVMVIVATIGMIILFRFVRVRREDVS